MLLLLMLFVVTVARRAPNDREKWCVDGGLEMVCNGLEEEVY